MIWYYYFVHFVTIDHETFDNKMARSIVYMKDIREQIACGEVV